MSIFPFFEFEINKYQDGKKIIFQIGILIFLIK